MKTSTINYFFSALILLTIICNRVIANESIQQIDSLKLEILKTSSDSVLINQYASISRLYREIDKDSALYYSDKSIKLSRNNNYIIGIAHGNFDKGVIYFESENFENSLECYLSALKIYMQENDSINISGVYLNLGILYSLGFDKQTAIDYYIKALELSTLLNDSANIANTSNNIGLIYRDLNNYDKAVEYLNQTLEIDLISGIQEYIAQSYSNIARSYLPAKEFEKTFTNLTEALKRIDFVKSADVKVEILSCAGEYYLEMNNPDSAIKYIHKAIAIADQAERKRTLAYTYFLVGRYFMVKKIYPLAITHFKEAIKLTDSLNVKEYTIEYYEYISKAYIELGDYKNAHLNLQMSYAMKDSMQMDALRRNLGEFEKQKEFVRVQSQFNFEQQQKQSELEKGALKLKLVSIFSILVIIFLIIIFIITINNFRNKTKANKDLKEKGEIIEQQSEELKSTISSLEDNEKKLRYLNSTKDKFFSIIAHDLKNPFNVLLGYADLLANEPSINEDPQKRDKIIKAIYSTSEFSYELLENLLAWSRSQTGGLKVHPEQFDLSDLLSSKIEFYKSGATSKNITINFDLQAKLLINADQNMILTVIRNLINNAVKFTNPGGNIDVIATQEGANIIFSVSDNGIGISLEDQKKLFQIDSDFKINGTANETGTGLGLILSKEFINQNGGEISVESEEGKGSIFTFTLPIAKTDE